MSNSHQKLVEQTFVPLGKLLDALRILGDGLHLLIVEASLHESILFLFELIEFFHDIWIDEVGNIVAIPCLWYLVVLLLLVLEVPCFYGNRVMLF